MWIFLRCAIQFQMALNLNAITSFPIIPILYLIIPATTALLPLATTQVTQGCDWQAIMTSVSFTTGSLIKHFQLELCQLFLNSVFGIASRLTITNKVS